jgi:hypothetical protein
VFLKPTWEKDGTKINIPGNIFLLNNSQTHEKKSLKILWIVAFLHPSFFNVM